jgi:hypothetical protein
MDEQQEGTAANLSDAELDALMDEINAMPSPPIKIYRAWGMRVFMFLFYKTTFNSEDFSDGTLERWAAIGKRFYNAAEKKRKVIEVADLSKIADMTEEDWKEKEKEIRAVFGKHDERLYAEAVSFMKTVCYEHSIYEEIHSMELGLPINSALYLAAYFYRPVFYINLWGDEVIATLFNIRTY